MEGDEIEVPKYFLCPISLQIMADPVTAVTGITYDRESIQQWLSRAEEATCPVTKQALPRDAELTPNHMLRRLIQAWCIANTGKGIDRIPTPKSPLLKSQVLKLIRETKKPTFMAALGKLDSLAKEEDEKNRKCMGEAGVVKAMVLLVLRCFKDGRVEGVEEGFRVLCNVWLWSPINKEVVEENHHDLIQAIFWVLGSENFGNLAKTHAIMALKRVSSVSVSEVTSSILLEKLTPENFQQLISLLRTKKISPQATKASLQVLIEASQWGRNKVKIIESNAISELLELELSNPEKRVTELTFQLLASLCSIADGRQELLKHAAAIAVISKRTLRVSAATDESAVQILAMIAKWSATREVVQEMLRVGAVSKLCMLLQAVCQVHLKKKAREILRLHSTAWSNSPCIQIYLLTMNAR
ncbi:PREDICTED: E3 ubiquitin-protein ligase PUB24-like [Ipomoea nil]|uniref:E3 ubiquitin-protein ligase PUB24-like n=1 Tax=Ipomoea nil TaxID=35883 RepID=UPI000901BA35|nr:PREDICTED: E3 ubiquitin-protein ligase PUB24-like [Ipomoea nil]